MFKIWFIFVCIVFLFIKGVPAPPETRCEMECVGKWQYLGGIDRCCKNIGFPAGGYCGGNGPTAYCSAGSG
uniref:Uncharacterized protein n=1 Tax=Panagrolaimus sp. ES5 TaxID=591445 RepID=A0AC34GCN9_9BILA